MLTLKEVYERSQYLPWIVILFLIFEWIHWYVWRLLKMSRFVNSREKTKIRVYYIHKSVSSMFFSVRYCWWRVDDFATAPEGSISKVLKEYKFKNKDFSRYLFRDKKKLVCFKWIQKILIRHVLRIFPY